MALTNAQVKEILSEAGVPSENINSAANKIMEGHTISLDYLRGEIKTYKEQAEKLPTIQKELDDLKQTAAGNADLFPLIIEKRRQKWHPLRYCTVRPARS